MKRPIKSHLFYFVIFLFAVGCSSDSESISNKKEEEVKGLTVSFNEHFQIVVPSYFEEMFDINPNASVQYGFINTEKDTSKPGYEDEIYVTVMTLSKSDLEPTFADTGRITLNRVDRRTAINLDLILEDFKVVNENPKPTLINGLAAIKNEFSGKLKQYEVFYKMAIFETESDFYQLLTWCMQKHANKHTIEMDAILHSFENI